MSLFAVSRVIKGPYLYSAEPDCSIREVLIEFLSQVVQNKSVIILLLSAAVLISTFYGHDTSLIIVSWT